MSCQKQPTQQRSRGGRLGVAGLILLASLGAVGCQSEVGGQTLPSAYYMSDDVQYFPPGTEFKLSREAAALKAAKPTSRTQRP